MNYLSYLVYIVFWESLCYVGTGYVVFVLDRSPWWFVLAIYLSFCCFKPDKWIHGKENLA